MDTPGMPSLPSVVAAGLTPLDASSQVETNYETIQSDEESTPPADTLSLDLESRPTKRKRGRPKSNDTSTSKIYSLAQPQTVLRQSG